MINLIEEYINFSDNPSADFILDIIERAGMPPPSCLKIINIDPKKLTIWQWDPEND